MVYDLIVLGILLFAAIRGAAKGMAWQLAAIASLVLCFLFATPLSVPVAQMIKVDPPANRWIAMAAIYIVFSLLCFGAARAIRSWLESIKFVEYDRHLGAMFGLLKGALFCFVMTFFLVCVNGSLADYVLHTKTGYVTALAITKFHTVMPEEIDNVLHRYIPDLPAHDQHGPLEEDDHDHFATDDRDDHDHQVDHDHGHNQYRPKNDFRGSTRPQPVPVPKPRSERDLDLPDQLRPERKPASEDPLSLDSLVDKVSDVLGQKVQDAVTNTIQDIVTPEPAPHTPASRLDRAGLTDRISALFSGQSEVRQSVRDDIDATLDRVPPEVAEAALRDWYGDLMGQSPDLDPETDVTTDLARRVERQSR